jgi:hypothetical protein
LIFWWPRDPQADNDTLLAQLGAVQHTGSQTCPVTVVQAEHAAAVIGESECSAR